MDATNAVKVELPESGTDAAAPAVAVVPTVPPGYKAVVLPSGASALVLVSAKGRHVKLVMRLARGMQQDPALLIFAHIAVKVTIDGRALTMEDIEELPEDDINALTPYVMGNAPSSASII